MERTVCHRLYDEASYLRELLRFELDRCAEQHKWYREWRDRFVIRKRNREWRLDYVFKSDANTARARLGLLPLEELE